MSPGIATPPHCSWRIWSISLAPSPHPLPVVLHTSCPELELTSCPLLPSAGWAEPWPPRSPRARTPWPSTKWLWWGAVGWGSLPSPSSSCMTRWGPLLLHWPHRVPDNSSPCGPTLQCGWGVSHYSVAEGHWPDVRSRLWFIKVVVLVVAVIGTVVGVVFVKLTVTVVVVFPRHIHIVYVLIVGSWV